MVSTARRERSRPSPAETPAPVVNDPDINNQFPAGLVMQEAPYHSAAVFQIRDILRRYGESHMEGDPIVESNLLVLFDSAGRTARLVPDIFVAFEATEYLELSFRVPSEKDLRMLVLEVLSKGTHKRDRSTKMLSYAEMGCRSIGCSTRPASCRFLACRAFDWRTESTCAFPGAANPGRMLCIARSYAPTCT